VVNSVSCTSFSSNFGGKLSFMLSFFPVLLHIFSLLLPVQLGTMITLEPCALNVSFSISYWDLINIYIYIYLADTTERGDKGWKQAQRQGEERVTLRRKTLNICIYTMFHDKGGKKKIIPILSNRILKSGETNMNLLFYVCPCVHVTLENSRVHIIKCQIWYLKQNK